MEQMTVKKLAAILMNEVNNGNGDKAIVIADDSEGNGYHGMFFGVTSDLKTVKECLELSNGLSDSIETNPQKIVILG